MVYLYAEVNGGSILLCILVQLPHFEVPYRRTSIKDGAHRCFLDFIGIHAPTLVVRHFQCN